MKALFIYFILFLPIYLIAQQEDCNCCSQEQKAFDFWVGEWKVTDSNGNLAGYNTITKEESGCVLKEKWTSAKPGYTGTSNNFFNKQSKNWEQLWVDNSGNHLKLIGNKIGNQMILSSEEFKHTDGKFYVNRISWTENSNGTVRQLWEVLSKGKVVNVLFDGLYARIK
ncbi:hypothetical protein [Croceitalea rosinachiae]|uniref:Lipocalin-like domain-containing protein n=1 Tax=Croceitalea rosinachiae TaxID=3075596 RepID=A0ABU3ADC0_9FLAO|nr:hypothetical protein [Croceitalea sp. F388]MDT0608179.1 hypothetical protein [Croceitalea sp. F388]